MARQAQAPVPLISRLPAAPRKDLSVLLTLSGKRGLQSEGPNIAASAEICCLVAWISLLESKQRGRWICHVNDLAGSKGHNEGGGGGNPFIKSGIYNIRAAGCRFAGWRSSFTVEWGIHSSMHLIWSTVLL